MSSVHILKTQIAVNIYLKLFYVFKYLHTCASVVTDISILHICSFFVLDEAAANSAGGCPDDLGVVANTTLTPKVRNTSLEFKIYNIAFVTSQKNVFIQKCVHWNNKIRFCWPFCPSFTMLSDFVSLGASDLKLWQNIIQKIWTVTESGHNYL